MAEHFLHCSEIAVTVVTEWPVQNRFPLILQKKIIDKLSRIYASARRPGGDAVFRSRFIVRWITQWKDAVPIGHPVSKSLVWVSLGNELLAEIGPPQMLQFLIEGQISNRVPARSVNKGILRNLETEHDAGRAGQHLPKDR